MASSCLGDRKQVQDARFDSHLTGVKKNVEVNIDVDKISYLVSLMLFIKYYRNTNIIIVCKTALLELLHSKSNILE